MKRCCLAIFILLLNLTAIALPVPQFTDNGFIISLNEAGSERAEYEIQGGSLRIRSWIDNVPNRWQTYTKRETQKILLQNPVTLYAGHIITDGQVPATAESQAMSNIERYLKEGPSGRYYTKDTQLTVEPNLNLLAHTHLTEQVSGSNQLKRSVYASTSTSQKVAMSFVKKIQFSYFQKYMKDNQKSDIWGTVLKYDINHKDSLIYWDSSTNVPVINETGKFLALDLRELSSRPSEKEIAFLGHLPPTRLSDHIVFKIRNFFSFPVIRKTMIWNFTQNKLEPIATSVFNRLSPFKKKVAECTEKPYCPCVKTI